MLLTNGGMVTEKDKAEHLNELLGLKDEKFEEKHIVLCHTPLGEPQIVDRYKDDIVLVAGVRGTQTQLAENYKLHRYVSLEEYAALQPWISYFTKFDFSAEQL